MHDYVRRLVIRLREEGRPLSRNRHFHTFATPQGRQALKLSRHLRSLARDVVALSKDGGSVEIERLSGPDGAVRVLLRMVRLKVKRTTFLSPEEWELLLQEEGVRQAVGTAAAPAGG